MAATASTMTARLGALACQRNSFLKTLDVDVIECIKATIAGKKKSKTQTFLVQLEDTILFPTGGGQPCDYGKINGHPVTNVVAENGKCIHHVTIGEQEQLSFDSGSKVHVELDWPRRLDHMQHHSAQHLLSYIAKKFGYETTTWSFGEEKCNVELVPHAETQNKLAETQQRTIPTELLLQMEQQVNQMILDAVPVKPHLIYPGDAEWKQHADHFAANAAPDVVRIMKIGDVDENPCCGTHVNNTAQLRGLKILSWEYARGTTRVWFNAGDRLLASFSRMHEREQAQVKLLCCAPPEHATRIEKLIQYQKSTTKDLKSLQKEMAVVVGQTLVRHWRDNPELKVMQYHLNDGDVCFMQWLLAELDEPKQQGVVLVLSVSSRNANEGLFLMAGPESFVANHAKQVIDVIGGKGGGGKNGILQGKAQKLSKMQQMIQAIEQVL